MKKMIAVAAALLAVVLAYGSVLTADCGSKAPTTSTCPASKPACCK